MYHLYKTHEFTKWDIYLLQRRFIKSVVNKDAKIHIRFSFLLFTNETINITLVMLIRSVFFNRF